MSAGRARPALRPLVPSPAPPRPRVHHAPTIGRRMRGLGPPSSGSATTPAKAQPRPSDFFTGHSKYCHDGGITFAASSAAWTAGRQLLGSMIGIFGPLVGTWRSGRFAGEMFLRRRGRRLWGRTSARMAGLADARSTATTGAWPSATGQPPLRSKSRERRWGGRGCHHRGHGTPLRHPKNVRFAGITA
jgi:hypothetical protein